MPKISVDAGKCIGCGACVSVWDNFEVVETEEGFKAVAKKAEAGEKELALAKEAKDICPVDAIQVK